MNLRVVSPSAISVTEYFMPSRWHSAFATQPREAIAKYEGLSRLARVAKDTFAGAGLLSSSDAFPRSEIYGLTIQIRRCAASMAADIAEGCGKRGNGEFQRFLNIAGGSASELEYHFLLAKDLAFLSAVDCHKPNDGVVEVKRMLAALARKVEAERFASWCRVLSAEGSF
jgi:four helix bundle protein